MKMSAKGGGEACEPALAKVTAESSEEEVLAFLEENYGAWRELVTDALLDHFNSLFESAGVRGGRRNSDTEQLFAIIYEEVQGASESVRIEKAILIAIARGIALPGKIRMIADWNDKHRLHNLEELRQQYQDYKRRRHPLLDPDRQYGVGHFDAARLACKFNIAAAIFVTSNLRNRRIIAEKINAPLEVK